MKKIYCFFKMNILKIALFSWLLFLAVFYFNLFYPFKVVTFNKFEATKPVYAQGEPICVDMDFVKHRDFKGDIRWLLVDGVAYELPAGVVNRGVGADTYIRCFVANVPSGVYHIRLEAEYTLLKNLRRILVEQETDKFIIE